MRWRSEELAVVGQERQWAAAPGGGAVALFEHEGRHTLTWLWAVHSEASTSVSLRQFPWASGWGLLGATELDGDPEPELVGVRRGHAAVVDWRDDEWRWSKPILAKPGIMSLLGAARLDANRGTDLMFWNPATLVGGCSSVGCSSATRLRELDDTNTRAFMDRAGTITWVRAGTISQLCCEIVTAGSRFRSWPRAARARNNQAPAPERGRLSIWGLGISTRGRG